MRTKLAAGLIAGIALLFLSFYGVDFRSVLAGMQSFDAYFLAPAIAVALLVQFLRSYRWSLLLEPMDKIPQLTVFSITSVGFMAIMALPARIGELARPYLISRKSTITMPAALATIVAERIFDTLAVLGYFSAVLVWEPLPDWLKQSGYISAALTATVAALVFPAASRNRLLALTGRLPDRFSFLRAWAGQFNEGMAYCSTPGRALKVGLMSLLIWGLNAYWFYIMAQAFRLDIPAAAAVTLMVVIIIGIAVPAAPGFIGNWHFACIAGLAIFGIPKSQALSYALVSHFLGTAFTAVAGLVFLPALNVNMSELFGLGKIKGFLKGETE